MSFTQDKIRYFGDTDHLGNNLSLTSSRTFVPFEGRNDFSAHKKIDVITIAFLNLFFQPYMTESSKTEDHSYPAC